jgi:hypothetical protein
MHGPAEHAAGLYATVVADACLAMCPPANHDASIMSNRRRKLGSVRNGAHLRWIGDAKDGSLLQGSDCINPLSPGPCPELAYFAALRYFQWVGQCVKNNRSRVAFVVRSRREERPKLPLSLEVDILLQSGILSRQASLPAPKAAASRPHYK